MKRRIALIDVTAMAGAAVCVAGIDLANKKCVRLNDPSPQRSLVARYSIKPGAVFEIDYLPARGTHPPHVEDVRWNSLLARRVGTLSHDELLALITPLALAGTVVAFGAPSLSGGNRNSAWGPDTGARSLATIRAKSVRVHRTGDRPRITITDSAGDAWASVPMQDLAVKLHTETCPDCRDVNKLISHLQRDFDADDALIRIGLTRPFAPDGAAPACWLQVTNVFARPRAHFV